MWSAPKNENTIPSGSDQKRERLDLTKKQSQKAVDRKKDILQDCAALLNKRIFWSGVRSENTIEVFHSSWRGTAKFIPATYDYQQIVKLQGKQPFLLDRLITLHDGRYKGSQALIIKTDMRECFAFLKLPLELRVMIYERIFSKPAIHISKRRDFQLAYSPGFGGKNKLAILRLNRQIRTEATPVLYNRIFEFSSTCALAAFLRRLLRAGSDKKTLVGPAIRNITINQYFDGTAKECFELLTNYDSITKVQFKHLYKKAKPISAAKKFCKDAKPFLKKCVATRGVDATLSMFSFRPQCMTQAGVSFKFFSEQDMEQFTGYLKKWLVILKAMEELNSNFSE